jgi:hypothetical protein
MSRRVPYVVVSEWMTSTKLADDGFRPISLFELLSNEGPAGAVLFSVRIARTVAQSQSVALSLVLDSYSGSVNGVWISTRASRPGIRPIDVVPTIIRLVRGPLGQAQETEPTRQPTNDGRPHSGIPCRRRPSRTDEQPKTTTSTDSGDDYPPS